MAGAVIDEAARLRRLHSLAVLDTEPETVFDQITHLAAELCGMPVALLTLVDAERQWFKSNVGLPGVTETPREAAFCAHTIEGDTLLEVPDTWADPRFAGNPMVTGTPGIRCYAGAPLILPDGVRLGSLCVIDRAPGRLTALQRTALAGLARLVVSALLDRERRLAVTRELETTAAHYRLVVEGQTELVSLADREGRLSFVNTAYAQTFGRTPQAMIGRPLADFVAAPDREAVTLHLRRVFETGTAASGVNRMRLPDGEERWVAWTNRCVAVDGGRDLAIHSVGRDITAQRRAEQAAAASERRSRALYESTPAMMHSIDLEGRLLHVSDLWLRKLGYTRSEVLGRPAVDFMTAPSRQRALEQVLPRLFASGRCSDVDHEMLRRDGTVLEVRLSAVLEHDPEGRPLGSLSVMQDMTEQRAADAALAEQQQRFRLLVEGVRDYAIYLLDPEGRVATWNLGAERIKGYAAEEVLGRHFGLFFVAEDAEAGRPEQALAQAARDGRYEAQGWRRRRDGSRFWASVLLTPLRDGQQRLVGYAKITRDLTELRRQQDLLVRVAEMAPCAMLLVDAGGRIAMVNAEAERIFGYSRAELLAQPLEMLVPQRLRHRHAELRLGFVGSPRPRSFGAERGLCGLRKDGEEFPAEIGLSPIDSADGVITLAAVFDITERRRRQLETERALAEKENLLKEVYHRVKNNLQVVQSLLTLQRHALPDGPARAAFDDSVQRVRAMALVHEKLYQSGDLAAVPLDSYVRDLVKQIAESHDAAARNVSVHADIPKFETRLDSAVPLGLLLTELVTNGLKHAFVQRPRGEIRVGLSRLAGGDLLTVRDDGIGFADDFDPRAASASLGLQLASGLARQLGGELHWHNEGGAVVRVLLTQL